MIVTITGKPGTGKSTAARYLKKRKANLIDADRLGHELIRSEYLKKSIKALFPQLKRITRKTLAETVFQSRSNLEKYNKIVHPRLVELIHSRIKHDRTNIIDAALFYELNLDKISDTVILIRSKPKTICQRVSKDVAERGKYQKSVSNADYVLDNDGVLNELFQKLDQISAELGL